MLYLDAAKLCADYTRMAIIPFMCVSLLTLSFTSAVCTEGTSTITITQIGPEVHRRLKLGLNKALVIDLPTDASDILVADPSKADALIRTSRRIFLFGKAVGRTNIVLFGGEGEQMASLDIAIERDVSELEQNLNKYIPDGAIKVEIVSDNIVLTGSVRSALDSARAVDLAEAFLKGGEATTRSTTATSSGEDGSVALFNESRQKSQIVNLIQIEGEDQVTLKVTVAEVRRDILKQLGFDNVVTSNGVSVAQLGSPTSDADTATSGGGISALLKGSVGHYNLSTYVNALEQAKVIRSLAEPTLTAISGQAATFSSGGQALYSTTDSNGNTSYSTYDYGIDLSFTPIVLAAGRISLKISTSVSEPTTSVSGAAATYQKRSANTSVELPSGGSLVIGGLLQHNISQTTNGTPGLDKMPVLGALFRQKSNEYVESEIVIIATPYLARPVSRRDLDRPDDNFSASSDGAALFLNRVNKIYGNGAAPVGRYEGSVGFIYK